MPEYTPTTDQVRNEYTVSLFHTEHGPDKHVHDSVSDGDAEFDRWLTAHDRENRAIGWEAAINHVEPLLGQTMKRAAHADNPYRGDNE